MATFIPPPESYGWYPDGTGITPIVSAGTSWTSNLSTWTFSDIFANYPDSYKKDGTITLQFMQIQQSTPPITPVTYDYLHDLAMVTQWYPANDRIKNPYAFVYWVLQAELNDGSSELTWVRQRVDISNTSTEIEKKARLHEAVDFGWERLKALLLAQEIEIVDKRNPNTTIPKTVPFVSISGFAEIPPQYKGSLYFYFGEPKKIKEYWEEVQG